MRVAPLPTQQVKVSREVYDLEKEVQQLSERYTGLHELESELWDGFESKRNQALASNRTRKTRYRLRKIARYLGPAGGIAMTAGATMVSINPWLALVSLGGGLVTLGCMWAVGFGPLSDRSLDAQDDKTLALLEQANQYQTQWEGVRESLSQTGQKLETSSRKLEQKTDLLNRMIASHQEVEDMHQALTERSGSIVKEPDSVRVGSVLLPRRPNPGLGELETEIRQRRLKA